MALHIFELMVEFLEANVVLIGILMVAVEYLKLGLQKFEWYQGWMATVGAFVLGFLFAIPQTGFELIPYIAHGLGLGLVATGVYKIGEGLIRKS